MIDIKRTLNTLPEDVCGEYFSRREMAVLRRAFNQSQMLAEMAVAKMTSEEQQVLLEKFWDTTI